MNTLLLQLISGAAGGNILVAGFKNLGLGFIGSTLAGMIGGVLFGQLLQSLTGMSGDEGASDMQIFLTSLLGSAIGGAVLTAVVSWVKGMFGRSS
jgi:uncharacterized membrane protein YeaQ/YmgE (transglycosylase-associated protein family)